MSLMLDIIEIAIKRFFKSYYC